MPFLKGNIPVNKGKNLTPEHRKKISQSNKGKVFSTIHKKNLSIAWKRTNRKIPNTFTRKGIKLTPKERIKFALTVKRGAENNLWKGGISSINTKIRSSLEYKLWRIAVFERDNYTCIWCGARNGNGKSIELNADHIKRFADYPELRFAIDNGRTLCRECHKTTDTFGR